MITTPASSINSTAMDMARFMIMNLQKGRYEKARVISDGAARDMQRQHAGHPKIPGVAYGFFEDDYQGLRILEHGGNVAGFSSQMVLIPERNAGFFMGQDDAACPRGLHAACGQRVRQVWVRPMATRRLQQPHGPVPAACAAC